ncbi:unnamed protein product [Closterium sp. NIES-53]
MTVRNLVNYCRISQTPVVTHIASSHGVGCNRIVSSHGYVVYNRTASSQHRLLSRSRRGSHGGNHSTNTFAEGFAKAFTENSAKGSAEGSAASPRGAHTWRRKRRGWGKRHAAAQRFVAAGADATREQLVRRALPGRQPPAPLCMGGGRSGSATFPFPLSPLSSHPRPLPLPHSVPLSPPQPPFRSPPQPPPPAATPHSPPGYYFRPGSGEGADAWHVHLPMGGWCFNLSTCADRAKTFLGSSRAVLQEENPYRHVSAVKLSGHPEQQEEREVNPRFYNWNVVVPTYCCCLRPTLFILSVPHHSLSLSHAPRSLSHPPPCSVPP